ncbi:MAG: hypothetical protein A3H98_07835 [Bacteroidetes bacterium RIFCSPLOWO2_02_FULL_36_8]|nr:MAG: hypothetical protein A3H98_07835 [Bacteroidetes bacterium RIFCSPLOWO2_02_FULL_36_8]OFY69019.1 MAG: hypothetical protein A3G23_13130 [Bacteroidetes bacterium RIFCSPLOWO2_12_FULL_37_12]
MKKLNSRNLLFTFASVCLSFSACKDDKPAPPTYYLTQDMYDYVIFPVGSWWVYKDSATGALDTVKVISQEIKIIEEDGDGNGVIDYKWEYLLQDKSKTFPAEHIINCFGMADELEKSHYSIKIEKTHCFGQTVIIFVSNISLGNSNYSENIYYIELRDSLLSQNFNFHQIKIFKISRVKTGAGCDIDYDTTSKYDGIYYYAKSVGLIKKTHTDSLNWELINYHINK